MIRKTVLSLAVLTVLGTTVLPAAAQSASRSGSGDFGFRAWGVRVGVADDPDQVIGGIHLDLGELVANLRMQPDIEIGVGDDATTVALGVPVHWRFDVGENFAPYVGAGVRVVFVDFDRPAGRRDDSDTEIGLEAIGGLEWGRQDGRKFFLELTAHVSDVHDFQLMAGWTF